MWSSQYNQQPPPHQHQTPQGPPPGGPPPGPPQLGPPPGGYNYGNQDYDEQGGSALTSAVDMVASGVSGLFSYGNNSKAPPPQQPTAPPAFQSSPQPPQAFSQQFQQPIQPTTSMLSPSPNQQPPPIQVTSSLLSTAPRRPPPADTGGPPTMVTPGSSVPGGRPTPIPVTSSLLSASGPAASEPPPGGPPMAASGGPPLAASSGPPPIATAGRPPLAAASAGEPPLAASSAPPFAVSGEPPMAASGGPPSKQPPLFPLAGSPPGPALAASPAGPPPLAASSGPPMAASSGPPLTASAGPPAAGSSARSLTVSTGPPLDGGLLAAGIPTPRGPASVTSTPRATPPDTPNAERPITAISPRSSSTKKLPLPPPSSTLERRRRDKGKKFKLPPAFSTTTPRKKKEFTLPPKMADDKAPTEQQPGKTTSTTATAPPAKPASSTPSAQDATPKRSNIAPPVAKPAEPMQSMQEEVAPPEPIPAPAPQDSTPPTTTTAPENVTAAAPAPAESSPEIITKPALPPGWQEVTDPNTGSIYYWNEDGTTSWEQPVLQQEEAPPVQPEETATAPPTEQKSAAEAPAEPSPPTPTESRAEPSQPTETLAAVETQTETEQPESTANQLPSGWVEMKDEASGNPYYVNTLDNTTSWDRPQMDDRPPTKTATESVGASVEPENAPPEEARDEKISAQTSPLKEAADVPDEKPQALSSGWTEFIDEGTGRPYYVEEASGTTTWDRPVAPAETLVEERPETAGEEMEVVPTVSCDSEGVQGADELAPEITQTSKTPDQNNEDAAALDTTMEILGDTQDALPPGWTEAVDQSSGRTYYVNEPENITTWERPVVPTESPVDGTDEIQAEVKEDGELKEAPQQPAPEVAGEKEEPEVVAPEITDTQSQEPTQEESANEDNVDSNEGELPPGWVESQDPASGSTFYFNTETNESRWEKPSPPLKAAVDVDEPSGESVAAKPDAVAQDDSNDFVLVSDDQPQAEESTPELTHHTPTEESTQTQLEVKADANESTPETEKVEAEQETSDEVEPTSASQDLPPDWEELFDANSKVTYYYNAKEGKSSWERPVSESAPSAAPEVNEDSTAAEPKTSTVEPETEEVAAVSEMPVEEPEEAKETPQEEPAGKEGTAEHAAGQEEQLPPGWVVVDDPSTGSVFFFNEIDRITSWERPSFSEAKAEEKPAVTNDEPDSSAAEMATAMDNNEGPEVEVADARNETEKAPSHNDLPAGWVELTDPTGNVYYYNEADYISSWEKPAHSTGAEDATPQESNELEQPFDGEDSSNLPQSQEEPIENGTIEQSEEADKSEAVSDLPDGWEAMVDESSGNTYYYNHADSTTSWERPTEPDDVDSPDAVAPGMIPALGEEGEQATDVAAVVGGLSQDADVPLEPANENEVDEDELPPGWVEGTEANTFEAPAEEPTAENTSGDSGQLPPGWVALEDPSSDRIYYFNEVDGTTSWEFPGAPLAEVRAEETAAEEMETIPAADESTPEREEEKPPQEPSGFEMDGGPDGIPVGESTGSKTELPTSAPDALPPGWEETQDAEGRVYYYNHNDQTASWERPVLSAEGEGVLDDALDLSVPYTLKRVAEFNVSNSPVDESEGPVEMLGEEKSSAPADSEIHFDAKQADAGEDAVAPVEAENETQSDASDQTGSQLPPGWVEEVDESTGQLYFYNEVDMTTSWERPTLPNATENEGEPQAVEGDNSELPEVQAEPTRPDSEVASADDGQQQPKEETADDRGLGDDVAPTNELPPGWVSSEDEGGNVYYHNQVDGTTSWERPIWPEPTTEQEETTTEPTAEQVQPLDLAEPGAEATAEQAQPLDLAEAVADAGQHMDIISGDPAQQGIAADSLDEVAKQADLLEGWTENVDPATGNLYYLHVDGTSTWERPSTPAEADAADEPSPEVEISDSQPVLEEVAQTETQTEQHIQPSDNASSGQLGLPSGWEEVCDENGNIYYYNQVDNTTSWDKPAWPVEEMSTQNEGDEPAVAGKLDDLKASMQDEGGGEQQVGEDYPGSEAAAAESAEPPTRTQEGGEGMEGAEEYIDQTAAPPVGASVPETEAPAPEAALPPGWIEQFDEDSGRPYYTNTNDNTTSWDKPVFEKQELVSGPGDEIGDAGEPSLEGSNPSADPVTGVTEVEPESTVPENGGASGLESPGALPDGWEEMHDPASGNVYYINHATHETTWDRPSAQSKEEDKASSVAAPEPMPQGWEEQTDPSGNVYYFNQSLGITQWERPVANSSPKQDPLTSNLGVGATPSGTANAPGGGDRRRPSHAIATFGFGGRLCVFRANDRRQVEVHRTRSLVPSHPLIKIEASKQRDGISGPLNASDNERVKAYVKRKTEEKSADLLWHLIHIVSMSKGRIRSQSAMSNPNSPEAAIVDLMLADGVKRLVDPQNGGTNGNSGGPQDEAEKQESKAGMESIQNFILRGKRAEAVEVALESNNFALALLMSTFCDPQTYHHVVKQYADKVLRGGSPLHTIAMLFSGQLGPSLWSANPKELLGSWRYHLAALISNRMSGWDRIVVALGCKLQELGDIHAAHVCFMVSGLQLMSPILKETYMCLLGCDHLIPEEVSLMTQKGIEAYERTEAYEWAKRRGNPNALIRTLQPFKLHYAILLADLGFVDLAKKYLENILVMVELDGDETRFENNIAARLTLLEMCETPFAFKSALASFEQRLFQNIPEALAKGDARKPVEKSPPTMELLAMSAGPTVESEMSFMTATSHLQDSTMLDSSAPHKTKDKVKSNPAPRKIARKRNIKKDAKADEPEIKTPEDMGGTGKKTTVVPPAGPDKLSGPQSGPPATHTASAPPSQLKTPPTEKPKTDTKKPVSRKKPEPAPKSAPAVMAKRDWTFGMAGRMQKWLNPEATTADLGEGMQAYYDPDKKVWVFPGEDPAEVAKPLPPPPTPAEMAPKEEPKPEPDMATDPLAAMMAPPKRTPASYGRSRPGGAPGGVPATPRSLYGGMPPMPGSAAGPPGAPPPAVGGPGGAPPQFMVFKPSPKPEGQGEEQKEDSKVDE